ncbi:methionine adenosyltransferase [bacterium]|nr:methionine adenosyltransferase [bacterium]
MNKLNLEILEQPSVEEQAREIVERKGLGHPDSLADGIAEAVSRALSREYKSRYGVILHHNTDKVQIVGGQSSPRYGGGEMLRPIYILLSGRATSIVQTENRIDHFPVHTIALRATRDYLSSICRNLNLHKDVIIDSRIGQGASNLQRTLQEEIPEANDTSFGVGHAPLSETEQVVLEAERYMNSQEFKERHPETGEDIKVMGLREGDKITLTIACAFVSKFVNDLDHYLTLKKEITNELKEHLKRFTRRELEIHINTADKPKSSDDVEHIYLTVTGLSAEQGDDGSAGRGNRVNGLITPGRPMSMEAAAGKNPVNHVGKLYNIIAWEMAKDIKAKVRGVKEVTVKILSQIGTPITNPQSISIQLIPGNDFTTNKAEEEIEEIAKLHLSAENLRNLTERFLRGEVPVF